MLTGGGWSGIREVKNVETNDQATVRGPGPWGCWVSEATSVASLASGSSVPAPSWKEWKRVYEQWKSTRRQEEDRIQLIITASNFQSHWWSQHCSFTSDSCGCSSPCGCTPSTTLSCTCCWSSCCSSTLLLRCSANQPPWYLQLLAGSTFFRMYLWLLSLLASVTGRCGGLELPAQHQYFILCHIISNTYGHIGWVSVQISFFCTKSTRTVLWRPNFSSVWY